MTHSRPLKLCFISNPQSIHTRRWLDWFASRGHTVKLIADARIVSDWPSIETVDLTRQFNVRVIRFLAWAYWTRRLVNRWQPDILHAHRVSSAGWLGAFSGFHPFVVAPWGSDLLLHPHRSRLARMLAEYSLRRADLVIANSDDLRQSAIRYGAVPRRISRVNWTGVDRGIFHPDYDVASLRQSLGLIAARVVLSPRAIAPIYNIDIIVQSIPSVLKEFPGVIFIFLDFNVQPEYKSHLLNLISELGIASNVRWVGPFTRQEDLARLYCLADVIVSVPSSDSTSATVLEAMACSKPVIASDLPSLHEWIVDRQDGRLIPVRDSQALAAAAVQLLSSKETILLLGANSLHVVEQRGDYHIEMQKMENLYYNLLDGSFDG